MQKSLTTGSVLKNIVCFSLPYLLSYFLQTLYGMADLFIIGQYEGVASTTSVSIGSQVMHVLTVIMVGLTMGSTVSIGQAVGAKQHKKAAACIGNTVTLFLSLSLVLTAGLLLLRRPITAVGIVEKIIGFLFLVPSSMLSAVCALGAQNLGAGKPERAKQTLFWTIGLACGFGAVTVVAVQFLAEALVGLFTPDQAAVLAGGQYLRGYIWDSFFAGVQFSFSGYFCACGRSGLSFLHIFLSIVCVRIPGAYLTSRLFPQTLLPMGLANAAGSLFSICARWICPCRLFWLGQTLRITDCSQLELPTIQLAREQTEALIFLGKIGVSVSEEHLRAGDFSQYDGMFLAPDEEDQVTGEPICLPASACVRVRFGGSHLQSPERYRRLMDYIRANHLQPDGFSREITLIDYGLTNDTEKFVTEITIPVREA